MEQTFELRPDIKDEKMKNQLQTRGDSSMKR